MTGGNPAVRIARALFVLLTLVGIVEGARPILVASPKPPIRDADFAVEVVQIEPPVRLHETTRVTLRIHDRAKQATFVFRPKLARVIDDRGEFHAASAMTSSSTRLLSAGQATTVDFAFQLPGDAKPASLLMSFGAIGRWLGGERLIDLKPSTSPSDR